VGVNTLLSEAQARGDREAGRAVVSSSLGLMSVVAAALAVLSVVIAVVLPWPALTGAGDSVPPGTIHLAVGLYLVVFAMSVPLATFQRTLDGIGQPNWNLVYVLAVPAGLLLGVLLLRGTSASVAIYAVFAAVGCVVFGLLSTRRVLRFEGGRLRPRRASVSAAVAREVWRRSWPMAIISAASTVAFSLDPVVVSSTLGAAAAAEYVLAAKIAAMLTLVLIAPSPVMWNHFAGRRELTGASITRRRLRQLTAVWTGGSAVLALGMVLVGPTIASWWSRGDILVPRSVFVSFGLLLVVTALQYPTFAALSDPASLRFMAVTMAAMAAANLVLSLVLVRTIGLTGPVVASVVTLLLVHTLPTILRAHRTLPA
jgi:O-antigen/teichoic acid export membrane protein